MWTRWASGGPSVEEIGTVCLALEILGVDLLLQGLHALGQEVVPDLSRTHTHYTLYNCLDSKTHIHIYYTHNDSIYK